jgi:hypothetical protein
VNQRDDRQAFFGGAERDRQLHQRRRAPDQLGLVPHGRQRRHRGERVLVTRAQGAQDLRAARSCVGVAAQQPHAQLLQVLRNARHQLARRERVVLLLALDHLQRRAVERHVAGQRFVDHHAERVPIGGFGYAFAATLLG